METQKKTLFSTQLCSVKKKLVELGKSKKGSKQTNNMCKKNKLV